MSAENTTTLRIADDVADTVAFSLVEDALRQGEVTAAEAAYFKARYQKYFENYRLFKDQEQVLTKKSRGYVNDILAEKIALEKARLQEAEEVAILRRHEEQRNFIQKELESTEQRDTTAKFELSELKRVHEEHTVALENMQRENVNLVSPIIKKLEQEIEDLTNSVKATEETLEKETQQKVQLHSTLAELESMKIEKDSSIKAKMESLGVAESEPTRIGRQAEAIDKAIITMESELKGHIRKVKYFDGELEKQAKRKAEAEKLRRNLLEKLELNRQTIAQREQDVAIVRANLDQLKARCHDLVTMKLELQLRRKESDSELRHRIDQMSLTKKEYDIHRRQLKKKLGILDSVRQVLPLLELQLSDQQLLLRTCQEELEDKKREIAKLKEEIEVHLAHFLANEALEADKREALNAAAAEVDELEADVLRWMAETKRQAKLLAVLSAQRDIKSRDSARVEQKEREARQHVRIKELIILDLTKRCNEISNRLKEFSALYEVVKNERNKYVNLIQSSTQALAEMREKIRILNNEVEILGNESTAKDVALTKERSAHQQAQNQRDALRQDMNRLLSEYRSKQSTVEQQIQEIDKLNVVINNLEKEMLELKAKYERAVEERNVTGVQLIDRNDELCVLYERSNQQKEALRRGELDLVRKEEELRLLRLQTEELKRHFTLARTRIPELESSRVRVAELEDKLASERKRTEDISAQLENPENIERWRRLDGDDPDLEQLQGKIKVLEDRLDAKREQQLEKELVLEEVGALTERLRAQALAKRDAAKQLADQLSDLQLRIKDTTKKMLASVSELSMYQATALRLQQEKGHREKLLEDARWRVDHGEAPTEEAVRELARLERKRGLQAEAAQRHEEELELAGREGVLTKTAAEPRPTAYIPDDLGIPKPYGNAAPFKPTELGSTMRHIRPPQPKPIEI